MIIPTIIRVMAAAAYLFASAGFLIGMYLMLTPMSWWGVTYSNIEVVPPAIAGDEELVKIHRWTSPLWGVVLMQRNSELLTRNSRGEYRQWCLTVNATAATSLTNPIIISGLDEYISERCAKMLRERMNQQQVWVLVVYRRNLILGFGKQADFLIGPYIVEDGVLKQQEGLTTARPIMFSYSEIS